ncbi:MAG: hypothetical protein IH944_11105 [Armatimonadetes bacterium]|nr:hypothetical protein [Armatimonadota bacterium]
MIVALALALATHSADFDFYAYGPYAEGVPKPESILGYGPGERHTTFRDQERVMRGISDAASDRVRVFQFGESTEGRPLRIMVFGSRANIGRLEEIRQENARVAAGQAQPSDDLPAIVWINECIHGNETASFESGMWLAYTLAASKHPQITKMLDDAIVIVNPVYNPDGHERFVVWYNSISIGHQDPQAVEHAEARMANGRTNHYRFDLNRDRVSFSQQETRMEFTEFLRWNPQVYVDQHGQVGTYFFPPVAQSVHAGVDRERYEKWGDIFGKATANAFDGNGWRYFVRKTFDLYYPGYLDSSTSLVGSIGMTHETDGGRAVQREREDGSLVTLTDGVAKHFTSALAVIGSAAANKDDLLASFAEFKRKAVSGEHADAMKRIIITGDSRALSRLQSVLFSAGIVSSMTIGVQQSARSFYDDEAVDLGPLSDSLVVDLAQPNGPFAKALLAPGQDFEDEFTERQLKIRDELKEDEQYPSRDRPEFYDSTGWSLPLAHGLQAYWSSSTPQIEDLPLRGMNIVAGGKVGWMIPYRDQDDALAVIELLQKGVRVHQATKEMQIDERTVPAGTFFVFRDRNADLEDEIVDSILFNRARNTEPLDTSFPATGVVGPGSGSVRSLGKPNIAVVFGDQPNGTRFGGIWFALEQHFEIPFTPIGARALNGDLSEFTCIILPRSSYSMSDNLKEWVTDGGSLVLFGGTSLLGEKGFFELERSKLEDDKNPPSLPGTVFAATLNPRSPLAYGYDTSLPFAVPVSGATYYKAKKEGGGVVLLGDEPKVVSGWVWPDETITALKGTVWLHDEQVGRGHVVWFAQDPTSRAMWPGTYKLLLNAILLGR